MSRNTKSGARFAIARAADLPSPHSPTISRSRSRAHRLRMRSRASGSSSTMRVLIVIARAGPLERDGDGHARAAAGRGFNAQLLVVTIKRAQAGARGAEADAVGPAGGLGGPAAIVAHLERKRPVSAVGRNLDAA